MAVWRPAGEDLKAAFAELPDGWYSTAALRDQYHSWAADKPNMGQVSFQVFIAALKAGVCLDEHGRGHSRQWRVTRPGLNCRNWFVTPDNPS